MSLEETRIVKICKASLDLDVLITSFLIDVNYEDHVEIVEDFTEENFQDSQVICIGGTFSEERAPIKQMNLCRKESEIKTPITKRVWRLLRDYYGWQGSRMLTFLPEDIQIQQIEKAEKINQIIAQWLRKALVSGKANKSFIGVEKMNFIFALELVRRIEIAEIDVNNDSSFGICCLNSSDDKKSSSNLRSFFTDIEALDDLRRKHELNVCRIDYVPLFCNLFASREVREIDGIDKEGFKRLKNYVPIFGN